MSSAAAEPGSIDSNSAETASRPAGTVTGASPDSGERKTRYPGSSRVRSSCSSVLVPIIAK